MMSPLKRHQCSIALAHVSTAKGLAISDEVVPTASQLPLTSNATLATDGLTVHVTAILPAVSI
jgi:hypothetical protein